MEEELRQVIQLAECLSIRQLLTMRYTNQLRYLQTKMGRLRNLVDREIGRIGALIQFEATL